MKIKELLEFARKLWKNSVFHGTSSGALPALKRMGKLVDISDLIEAGIVPFTGELGFTFSQERSGTSFTKNPAVAMKYAQVHANPWNPRIEDIKLQELPKLLENYYFLRDLREEILDNRRKIAELRKKFFQQLSEEEKRIVRKQFPMVLVVPRPAKEDEVWLRDIPLNQVLFFVPKPFVGFVRQYLGTSNVYPIDIIKLLAKCVEEGVDPHALTEEEAQELLRQPITTFVESLEYELLERIKRQRKELISREN